MTTISDTSFAFAQNPMIHEVRPGLLYQEPLAYYNLAGDDAPLLNSAFAYLQGKYGGGTLWCAPMGFNIVSTVNVPWMCYLRGSGFPTIFNYSGNSVGVQIADPEQSQPPLGLRHQISGGVENLIIDGTNAGNNAILLNTMDVHAGLSLFVTCQNATGTSAVGWQCANNNTSINYTRGYVCTANCTTGALFTTLGAQNAMEHINIDLNCGWGLGQTGIHMANGVQVQSCRMNVTLSTENSNAGPGLQMDAGCIFQSCDFLWKHEMSPAPGTATSIVFGAASAKFAQCTGLMYFGSALLPASGIAIPNLNNQFTFGGVVFGDANLIAAQSTASGTDKTGVTVQTPAVPASTVTATNNNGVAVWVTLAGGTITGATKINGANVGDTSTRTFLLPINATIAVTYSAAPTWTWQPIG